jgi:hypothetical protein
MAKGQKRSNKEVRKPKATEKKAGGPKYMAPEGGRFAKATGGSRPPEKK